MWTKREERGSAVGGAWGRRNDRAWWIAGRRREAVEQAGTFALRRVREIRMRRRAENAGKCAGMMPAERRGRDEKTARMKV